MAFPHRQTPGKCSPSRTISGIPLDVVFVDLTKGAQREPTTWRSIPPDARPRWSTAISSSGNRPRSCSISPSRSPTRSGRTIRARRADIMRWQSWQLRHWSKEACEPLIFERLVKAIMNIGAPDPARRGKRNCSVPARGDGARCPPREAAVSDWRRVTLADFSVVAPLAYSKEAQLPIEPYGNIKSWFGRVFRAAGLARDSTTARGGRGLEHDPESGSRFSEKTMLKTKLHFDPIQLDRIKV